MKVFVTGVAGQLGHDVMNELAKRGYTGVGSDIAEKYSGADDGTAVVNMEYVQNISSRAVTLTNLVQIPIPHGKSSDIRRQYLEYAFRRKQVML